MTQPPGIQLCGVWDGTLTAPVLVEPKIDGIRCPVELGRDGPRPRWRDGSAAQLPHEILAALGRMERSGDLLDGELAGGVLHVFDLIPADNLAPGATLQPTAWRRQHLEDALLRAGLGCCDCPVRIVWQRSSSSAHELRGWMEQEVAAGGEGLVLKDPAAPWTPGDRTAWRKAKLWRQIDGIVTGVVQGVAGAASILVWAGPLTIGVRTGVIPFGDARVLGSPHYIEVDGFSVAAGLWRKCWGRCTFGPGSDPPCRRCLWDRAHEAIGLSCEIRIVRDGTGNDRASFCRWRDPRDTDPPA